MVTRKMQSSLAGILLLLAIFHTNVEAGPANRLVREVYPEIEPENEGNQAQVCIVGDVVYAVEEEVPAELPCLKCLCQPPGVQCETIKCPKKPGCKAIHRPNKCCPDYQCECQHEGKSYGNGERLQSPPGSECKVCYCRGGEVQCADVSCYIRSDCEAKTVPGQCCPKYDHCPPKEPLFGRPTLNTPVPDLNRHELELWPLNKILNTSEDNSNKIDTNQAVTIENTIKMTRATQTDFTEPTRKQIEEPKITIHEILPEIREIPITDPIINDLVTDAEPDSSEISEVFQQPPPVLRIGDKLLFLKQGEWGHEKDASTPTSVITIIGAEGLQRGFEESGEIHEFLTRSNTDQFSTFNDLEPKTSESTHILSLVKRKNTSTTTEPSIETTTLITTVEEETTTQDLPTTNPEASKILPEVLESRNNHTIPENASNEEWLKSEDSLVNLKAALPSEILNATAESDLEETTTEEIQSTTVSVESIEQSTEDSGESTTPNHASLISEENASIEPSESDDMVKNLNQPKIDDVEVIETKIVVEVTTEGSTNPMKKDVEVIEVDEGRHPAIKIVKREAGDDIFEQLESELNADSTERIQSEEDEKEESEKIFRDLLEETSTPKSPKKLDKDAETLQRVSDAIAKLTLKGKKNNAFDPSILSVITDFFGSQYRY